MMDIRIVTDTAPLAATLNDSPAARGLAAMLPLTLTLSDFHSTEKIADLPATLDTTGSPAGAAAEPGDIAYFAPWGNLAIFYRGFPRSAGLVILGRIAGPLDALTRGDGEQTVTIAATDARG
ncbi:cyclophilin-like fold protein [Isoptericola sp. F-RaC21]|uniref:cyclophilin-like fold protein n=1 Tax=Isoptericola sp. F-RaC21 TaxID=3141452 RepID=UPI00315C275E